MHAQKWPVCLYLFGRPKQLIFLSSKYKEDVYARFSNLEISDIDPHIKELY